MNLPESGPKLLLQGVSASFAGAAVKQAAEGDLKGAALMGTLGAITYGLSRLVEIEVEKGDFKFRAKFRTAEA